MKLTALLSLFAVLSGSAEATPLATEDTQLLCYNLKYIASYTYDYVGGVRYASPVYSTKWVCK